MTLQTCKSCRYWGAFTEGVGRGPEFSDDEGAIADGIALGNVIVLKRMGLCWRIEDDEYDADAEAVAVDASGCYAGLRTSASFGCTLHEAVETP